MINRYRSVFLTGVMALAFSGCSPLKFLYEEIRSLGFLEFRTPMADAGTGTLVGGKRSDDLFVVADGKTCFPDSSGLRRTKAADLPSRKYEVEFEGSAKADIFKFLESGNGAVTAGVNFDHVSSVHLQMSDVHVEFIDSVELTRFYREHIDDVCVEWLNHTAFVVEALYVGEMAFEMKSKDGGKIDLEADIPDAYIKVAADAKWEIRDKSTLVIKTPKYVGYKLGRLTVSDDGMSLHRANSLDLLGYYGWKEVGQFSSELSRPRFRSGGEAWDVSVTRFKQPTSMEGDLVEQGLLPEGYEPPWNEGSDDGNYQDDDAEEDGVNEDVHGDSRYQDDGNVS